MSVENLRLFWVPVNLDCLHVGLLELYAADYCTMNPSSSALSRMYRILEEKPVGSAARRFLAVAANVTQLEFEEGERTQTKGFFHSSGHPHTE